MRLHLSLRSKRVRHNNIDRDEPSIRCVSRQTTESEQTHSTTAYTATVDSIYKHCRVAKHVCICMRYVELSCTLCCNNVSCNKWLAATSLGAADYSVAKLRTSADSGRSVVFN